MNAVNLYPKNYGELLEVAKVATCLTWFRSGQNLVLVIDDKPNDRRTIISVSYTHLDVYKRQMVDTCDV